MITLEKNGAVATLTINRPESLNALHQELIIEFSNTLKSLQNDQTVRVVKVCGAGDKAFVAGADISQMKDMDSQDAKLFSYKGQHLFSDIEASDKIFIACVKGFALGGGCELALACDLIYASDKAKFGLPEVTLGLIPGFGGTQRLSRMVGALKAKELIYTGKMISAQEAFSLGMVNQVFLHETFDRSVDEVASAILKNGPFAVRRAKQAIVEGQNLKMSEALEVEKQHFAFCFSSPQSKEGMNAFLEKRKPNWDHKS
ncbi:MAG: enoyl-CoA hydratase/isomerase family protein [Bdellovibrionales bacterium]|nr:enoyl-CoA hydratase/isomerase family protein [Bdellovibrionales bacterium]